MKRPSKPNVDRKLSRRARPALATIALLTAGALTIAHSHHVTQRQSPTVPSAISIHTAGQGARPSSTGDPGLLTIPITTSSVDWIEHQITITYQGVGRHYLVFRPADPAAKPLPVVVTLAGCCASAAAEADRTDFRQVAAPAILVYPDYIDGHWNAGACCGRAAGDDIDDVGFVTTVIDQVRSTQPNAALGPVYLAGYSNGAKLAMEMACQEPSLFAAVAGYGATRTSPCNKPPSESVLEMAGTEDPLDAISGQPVVQNGFTEPTATQMVDSYVAADGCRSAEQSVTIGVLTETKWTQCHAERQVGVAIFNGDTHAFPETSGSSPSGQQVMWDFFTALGA